jgi:hypothetical protein
VAVSSTVFFLVGAVDAEAGPIVLTHAVHDGRIAQRGLQVGAVGFSHAGQVRYLIPGVRVSVDDLLGRLVGLAEEPPVPPRAHELLVQALEMFDHRKAVHHGQSRDRVGVVHGRAEGGQSPPVVTDHGEPVVAEVAQERNHVLGHGSLGGLGVPGGVGRQRRPPVAAQVGADDEEGVRQLRSHPVPGRMCSGVAVQQHDRLPLAAVAHPQRHLADVDMLKREPFEHQIPLCGRSFTFQAYMKGRLPSFMFG